MNDLNQELYINPDLELSLADYIAKYGPPPQEIGYKAVRWGGRSGGWFLAYADSNSNKGDF